MVPGHLQEEWERYSSHMQNWIQEGVDHNLELHKDYLSSVEDIKPISKVIYRFLDSDKDVPPQNRSKTRDEGASLLLPVWQMAPAPHDPSIVNYNLFRDEVFARIFHGMETYDTPVLSEATRLDWLYGGSIRDDPTHPHSFLLQPVYRDFPERVQEDDNSAEDQETVGVVIAVLPWDQYFQNLLPPEAHGIYVVMKDTCGDEFTYVINGADSIFVGWGDLHERKYNYLEEYTMFDPLTSLNASDTHDHCEYDLFIYPSDELKADFMSQNPIIYTAVVMMVFFCTSMIFSKSGGV